MRKLLIACALLLTACGPVYSLPWTDTAGMANSVTQALPFGCSMEAAGIRAELRVESGLEYTFMLVGSKFIILQWAKGGEPGSKPDVIFYGHLGDKGQLVVDKSHAYDLAKDGKHACATKWFPVTPDA